jgi:hypothetical protein
VRRRIGFVAALLVTLAALCVSPRAPARGDALPLTLADDEFWQLVDDLSEPGGSFRSENLISNEDTFQRIVPELRRRVARDGAYIGVGPEQNFTYIAAIRPRLAFIVDIRRQNMLLHLMYKALIEGSADRAEFLSRLFSRPRPDGLPADATVQTLFDAYAAVAPDAGLARETSRSIVARLVVDHRFPLTPEDLATIESVYSAFCSQGPQIRYATARPFSGRWFPSYAELMTGQDSDGEPDSYLATEQQFQILRDYERGNRVVPIVGDFSGSRALRSIGGYLREHGATVALFYTSNVEQYLFQTDAWRRFLDNVGALPLDENSIVLRSLFNTGYVYGEPRVRTGFRAAMLIDSMEGLMGEVRAGRIRSYRDVIERSK